MGDRRTGRGGARVRFRAPWVAALLAALVLAAGCGARLTDEQLAAVADGTGGSTASGSTGSGGGASASGAAAGSGSGTGSGTATGGSGGGSSATGSGAGASGGDAGDGGVAGDCAPEPSDEVGVTDTEIRLGNVSTVSGPIAGFGQTGLNAVKAYFNFVNSQGGVCGRQLVFVGADDRLDSGQNRAETQRLASEVLGFVGGTTVVDAGGTSVIDGTDIVATQLAVSDAAIQSANVFSPNPIDPAGTTQGTMGMWQYFARTRGVTKVAIVYPAQADARTRGRAYEVDIRNAGLEVVGPFEVAITETNYVNVAQQIENSGAQGVITALEITGMTRLAQAFAQIDFHPAVPFYGAQAYGRPFLEQAGAAAEGTTLGLAFAIFEDAPAVPAVADFLDWYGRTAPGSAPDFFAVMGWTAADMMVQALAAAGPAPTRAAVQQFLQGLTSFDAHGFLAANNPAGKVAAPGFMIVTVQGGQWVREYPAGSGFGTGS